MTVRVYRSTDASAPTLKGNVMDPAVDGSLGNLLNKVLVTGYGAAVAAGWTLGFALGATVSTFKQGSGSNGFYLQVDESTVDQSARCRGYETMSSNTVGTYPFPTTTQMSGGVFFQRSNTFDAVSRPWMIVATERTFYLWANLASTVYGIVSSTPIYCFGDFTPVNTTDRYSTIIIGGSATGTGSQYFGVLGPTSGNFANPSIAHYVARSYTGLPGSVNVTKANINYSRSPGSNAFASQGSTLTYPNGTTGKIYIVPITVYQSVTNTISGTSPLAIARGTMPGLWTLTHQLMEGSSPGGYLTGIRDESTLSSIGCLPGVTLTMKQVQSASNVGIAALETSDTW